MTTMKNPYPPNVIVHGNGFVQIKIAEGPYERETRLHIWHPELTELTQNVNTQIHDHRFGFVSTVLKGIQENIGIQDDLGLANVESNRYRRWFAKGDRLSTGNRPLVCSPCSYTVLKIVSHYYTPGQSYIMKPKIFHLTNPITEVVVTLMNKTVVLPDHEASVFCKVGQEPDQDFDRRQIPWEHLETLIKGCLEDTPFENVEVW